MDQQRDRCEEMWHSYVCCMFNVQSLETAVASCAGRARARAGSSMNANVSRYFRVFGIIPPHTFSLSLKLPVVKRTKVTMAHPSEVAKRGVPVSATTQREGEFVLTFPQVGVGTGIGVGFGDRAVCMFVDRAESGFVGARDGGGGGKVQLCGLQ